MIWQDKRLWIYYAIDSVWKLYWNLLKKNTFAYVYLPIIQIVYNNFIRKTIKRMGILIGIL